VCPLLRRVDAALDPAGKHLTTVDGTLNPGPTDITLGFSESPQTGVISGVGTSDSWRHVPPGNVGTSQPKMTPSAPRT
jgi:hypothetical protein